MRSLLAEGLIDELRVLVHPIVVGHGARLFEDSTSHALELVSDDRFSTGVLNLAYAPTAVRGHPYAVHVTGRSNDPGADLPPAPWARAPQRPRRARRDPLTQEAIVEAALRVLDADGLDQLSMRHVARTLNTTAGALYWHVGSKDGLLDLIFDRVIGEQHVPQTPTPRAGRSSSRRWPARCARPSCAHRDVVRLSIGQIPSARMRCCTPTACSPSSARGGIPGELAVVCAPSADLDRPRLRHRRDRRRRRAARRSASARGGGRDAERVHGLAAQRPLPASHRRGRALRRRATPTPSSTLLDIYVDGLAKRAKPRRRSR